MNTKKEVIFHFPLRKVNMSKPGKFNSGKDEPGTNELTRFYKLSEKLRNDEWHQEYFLIYNSYTLDNR